MMRRTCRPTMTWASLVAWHWGSLKYAGTVTTVYMTLWPKDATRSEAEIKEEVGPLNCNVLYSSAFVCTGDCRYVGEVVFGAR